MVLDIENMQKSMMPKFIADCHLGKLAKYLRLLGCDTLYFSCIDDNDLLYKAKQDNRIILTRDKELYEREKSLSWYLNETKTYDQLLELLLTFKVKNFPQAFTRCLICNEPLARMEKDVALKKLAPSSSGRFDFFTYCKHCDKVYWHGSHYKRMKHFIDQLEHKLKAKV